MKAPFMSLLSMYSSFRRQSAKPVKRIQCRNGIKSKFMTHGISRRALHWNGLAFTVLLLNACSTDTLSSGAAQLNSRTAQVLQVQGTPQGLVVQTNTPGSGAYAQKQAEQAQAPVVVRRASQPWVGRRMVAVQNDAALPALFSEKFSIQFDERSDGGRIPVALVAERLSRMSGVPVRVKQDVYSGAVGSGATPNLASSPLVLPPPTAATQPQVGQVLALALPATLPTAAGASTGVGKLPAGQKPAPTSSPVLGQTAWFAAPPASGPTLPALQMRWDGSLSGFLDHITGLLNLSWAYREGVVVIERLTTESFEITAFGGTQDYKMSLSGGNEGHGGFGSANSALDVHESGKLAALDSLKRALDTLVTPSGGSVTLNEGSGRLTVVAPKDVMTRVRELVRLEDASLRRQAHIQFDVYSVTRKDSDEYGLDWSGVISDLARTWSSTVVAPQSLVSNAAAQLNMTLLRDVPPAAGVSAQNTATRYGGSKAVLQALHSIGESAQYRPVGLVAMNRQWARKTSLRVTGYVAETTPATSAGTGSGSPGLKTGSVTTGDKFLVQPAIMDDGTIFLKFGVSLTDLLGLLNVSAGSGASLQTVQTPETTGTDDQGTIRLNPGEAMVITGLSRRMANSERNGLAEDVPLVLGGSRQRSYRREDFLIVVRATPL